MAKLQIKLIRSRYGWVPKHQKTFRALGLSRPNQTVVLPDNPAVRGMIKQVEFAVEVRPVEE